MTTLPILNRLCSMFTSTSPYNDTSDPLRQTLFSQLVNFVERDDCFNTISWSSIENGNIVKDCISDAYIYISHDRQLQVNKIIETELFQDEDDSELVAELNTQDNYYLKLIIENRKYIFG
jgi:hypothetical protein